MKKLLLNFAIQRNCNCRPWLAHQQQPQQRRFFVNLRPKLPKDRQLDHVVEYEKDLQQVVAAKNLFKRNPGASLPIDSISKKERQLGLKCRVSTFLRKYPSVFREFPGEKCSFQGRKLCLPWFKLTHDVYKLDEEEQRIQEDGKSFNAEKLAKLLMMSKKKVIPLNVIKHLKWDLGLPHDYLQTLVPAFPERFRIVKMQDNRHGLELLSWDPKLAISRVEQTAIDCGDFRKGMPLNFSLHYPPRYKMKRVAARWVEDWQALPYISPYDDDVCVNPNSDISEKRVVAVLHELLSLAVHRKILRKSIIGLREHLGLPHKFLRCFERHPGIFYLSIKNRLVTVLLREGFRGGQLVELHPLVSLRRKYVELMRLGVVGRKKGLFKRKGFYSNTA